MSSNSKPGKKRGTDTPIKPKEKWQNDALLKRECDLKKHKNEIKKSGQAAFFIVLHKFFDLSTDHYF